MTVKNIGHFSYATSPRLYNFVSICEFIPELQSGNTKFDSKSVIFCVPWDLEIWQMSLQNNRASLVCYFKHCISACSHWCIKTGVTVQKMPDSAKNRRFFLSLAALKFDRWLWEKIRPLFCATLSLVHHVVAIGDFAPELQFGTAEFGTKSAISFVLCDLHIWQMTFKNNWAPLISYSKLCLSFRSNWWIPSWVTFRIWRMTLKNNRAPLLCYLKLCASFSNHLCMQIGVMVRKTQIGANYFLTSMSLISDRWPGAFAWTSITSVNCNNSRKFHDDAMMGT